MRNTNTGGPAFPTYQSDHQGKAANTTFEPKGGMTLRDYFAAKAMQAWIAGPCQGNVLDEYEDEPSAFAEHQLRVAMSAYGYADAMLSARGTEKARNE